MDGRSIGGWNRELFREGSQPCAVCQPASITSKYQHPAAEVLQGNGQWAGLLGLGFLCCFVVAVAAVRSRRISIIVCR